METERVPAGKRVAIIEDDIPLREALVLFLRVKGWMVDSFGSGEESAGVANWGEYAVVICDLYLPGEDGLSVLRRVREASEEVVTVLVTAYPGSDIPAQAASAGIDRFLYKPFSTMELVESLGALTEKRAGRRALELTSV